MKAKIFTLGWQGIDDYEDGLNDFLHKEVEEIISVTQTPDTHNHRINIVIIYIPKPAYNAYTT